MKETDRSRQDMIGDLLSQESIDAVVPSLLDQLKATKEAGQLDAETAARLIWRLNTKEGQRLFHRLMWQTVDGVLSEYEITFLWRHRPKIPLAYYPRLEMIGQMAFLDWMSAEPALPEKEQQEHGTNGTNGTGFCAGPRDSGNQDLSGILRDQFENHLHGGSRASPGLSGNGRDAESAADCIDPENPSAD